MDTAPEHILPKAIDDSCSNEAAKSNVNSRYTIEDTFGYKIEELHYGLSCDNPAGLKEEEIVLHFGSRGTDVFLSAERVGPRGQVIGLDTSFDVISLARRTAQKYNLRPPHLAFVPASFAEPLPISSDSIDCIISNCPLLTGESALLKEAYRVLKPGGRIFVSLKAVGEDLTSRTEAISGVVGDQVVKSLFCSAGFPDAVFVDARGPSAWAASYRISAFKPSIKSDTHSTQCAEVQPLLRWWDAYPEAKSSPPHISPEEVAALLHDPTRSDYAVIDVRRNDHSGGHVRDSFQYPAQTFYDDLPSFVERFGNVRRVIFYCSSSKGRGPRCAGWYQDRLNDLEQTMSTAYVLEGGVKAWLLQYGDDESLVQRD